MAGFLLSIDQGTTGTTAFVLSPEAKVLGKANREFPQHFPKPGWVEHDTDEIWASVLGAVRDALAVAKVEAKDCLAIGITNQRETTVLWDRTTGEAIHKAIVWQDRRTADRCRALRDAGHEAAFRDRTGLVLDPYFSGTKLAWILDAVPGAREKAASGALAFGTIDSWLVWRLSGGAAHVTDASNASRTLLYDIREGQWSEELAGILGVPTPLLPEVRSCAEVYARTKGVPVLPDGIPIAGMAGDQQAALFGQTCFEVGDAKCTYGTGAFLLQNTGTTFVPSKNGLVTTIAWRLGGETVYALEGSAFIAGAAVQWLRDGLGVITKASEIEARASEVESAGDVCFVPALAGLGAPHWDPDARGLLCGLTRDTTLAHVCRAVLDGIAFQIADLVSAMNADAAKEGSAALARLRVDGGAAANALLMQFQADILGVPVDRPANVETTALGAAYLAGLGAGVFPDLGAIVAAHRVERTFEPQRDAAWRDGELSRWGRAVARARSTVEAG
ncbi:MAG: glycerol kinase GlpK [Sandaracinus sp.]|nr:glycerol kinase GlpK [Sandaracinus sp.]MCB9630848.1 glycerol kinase GlpK [Sandaracinus sp.]